MKHRWIAAATMWIAVGCGSVYEPSADFADGTDVGANPGGGGEGAMIEDAPAEVRNGAELYAKNCQVCHGVDAAGGPVYSGSIQGRTGILGQVRSGGGGMPAFGQDQLSDEDVAAIEAYLAWLANGGAGGGEARGYAGRCAGCHGPTGEGTDLAPQIRSPHEGYARWIVRNGRRTAGSLRYPQDMPAFGDSIDDGELDEILTFLQSQPMPKDGAGLYLRFCGNCHGPTGSGGVVGESARKEADDRDDFLEVVRSGNGGSDYGDRDDFMPGRLPTELSDEEVEAIRRFLASGGRD